MEEQEENEKNRYSKTLFFFVWIADFTDAIVLFDGDYRGFGWDYRRPALGSRYCYLYCDRYMYSFQKKAESCFRHRCMDNEFRGDQE